MLILQNAILGKGKKRFYFFVPTGVSMTIEWLDPIEFR